MNSQSGFSLVSVLVAAALLSLLTAGALTMINNMTVSVTFAESALEATNQIYVAKAILANTLACTENFKTVNLSRGSVAVTHLLKSFDPLTNALSSESLFPRQSGLKAEATTFRLAIVKNSPPMIANLQVGFDRRQGASIFRTLPLQVTLDAAGVITSCSTADAAGPGATPGKQIGQMASCENWLKDISIGLPGSSPASDIAIQMKRASALIAGYCEALTYPTGDFPLVPTGNCTMNFPNYRVGAGGPTGTTPTTGSCESFLAQGGGQRADQPALKQSYHYLAGGTFDNKLHLGSAFSNLKSTSDCKKAVSPFPHGHSWKVSSPAGVTVLSCDNGGPVFDLVAPTPPSTGEGGT